MTAPPRLVLLILAVEDLPRAAAFYDAAFGWEVRVAVPVYREYALPGGAGVSLYARGGFAVNTGVPPQGGPAPGSGTTATELYLAVEDLDAACARLRAAGARELSPPADRSWGDRAAYFADPDGNVLALAATPSHTGDTLRRR